MQPVENGKIQGMKSFRAAQPRYMRDFRCAGEACIDTCCQRWRVTVDRKSFDFLRKEVADPTLRPIIDKHLVRARSGDRRSRYGEIAMRDDLTCPFLTQARLCRIQKTLGAEALPDLCREYPRVQLMVDRDLEQYATPSCPEIARLLLSGPDAIELSDVDLPASEVAAQSSLVLTSAGTVYRTGFRDIRDTAISLIAAHAPDADCGLFAVLMLTQALDGRSGTSTDIRGFLADQSAILTSDEFRTQFGSLRVDPSIGLRLVKELVALRRLVGPGRNVSAHYPEIMAQCVEGVGHCDDDPARSLAGYRQARERFAGFVERHPWMLRNLLVDDLRRSAYPAGNTPPWEQAMELAIRYAFVKLMLIGLCGYWKDAFDIDRCALAVYSFSRGVAHTEGFVARLRELLKDAGVDSLGGAAVMLKT